MRPEVHDTDGLLVQDELSGSTWHPLQNPASPEFSSVPVQKLARFGLLQRDRRIGSYEDLEANYELRPSAWIEPIGDWGEGSIRLVELPTGNEFGDNIVAFWVPATMPAVGKPIQFSYRILWSLDQPANEGLARVVGTHEGELPNVARGRLFWIDFADEAYAARDVVRLTAELEVTGGKIRHRSVSPYAQIGGWRVAIEAEADSSGQPLRLRARLKEGQQQISENWNYQWKP